MFQKMKDFTQISDKIIKKYKHRALYLIRETASPSFRKVNISVSVSISNKNGVLNKFKFFVLHEFDASVSV